MDVIFALLLGYACGSIPFGLLLAKAAGQGDIRTIGSGNIGATNVLRTGKKWLAAATLLLDMGKGLAPVALATMWFPDAAGIAALGAILGHCFPVWLKFKGGKGVATLAGVCFGFGWELGAAYAAIWLVVLALTRWSSLAGMTAAVVAPVAAWLLGYSLAAPLFAVIASLVIYLHRANISRLLAGTEPKVGSKK